MARIDPAMISMQLPTGALPKRVGPFFTRFLSSLSSEVGSVVEEGSVARILNSWREEGELSEEFGHAILAARAGVLEIVLVRGLSSQAVGVLTESLSFSVTDFSGVLVIPSPCEEMTAVGEILVQIEPESDSREVVLGDNLVLIVEAIESNAKAMRISSTERSRAFLKAQEVSFNELASVIGSDNLDVVADAELVAPKLYRFRRDASELIGEVESQYQAIKDYVDLRAVLLAFGRSMNGDPTVFGEKMEKAIIKGNRRRQAIFEDLIARGVVYQDGTLIRLRLSGISALGFGLDAVLRGQPTPEVLTYLRSVTAA